MFTSAVFLSYSTKDHYFAVIKLSKAALVSGERHKRGLAKRIP
jgi:hypothetical protein